MASHSSSVLRPWNVSYNHSDTERWICVYPLYINSRKSVSEGRRIPKIKAIENPTAAEIRDSLTASGLQVYYEQDKCHPSEKEQYGRGRVRVQLRNQQGELLNPQFGNKNALLTYICSMIPKLKSRSSGGHSNQPAPQSSSSAVSGGGSKKNKKRK